MTGQRSVMGVTWTEAKSEDGDALVMSTTWKDFAQAMTFVNAVAFLAERANHHPDIAIHWNRVDLRLWSHDAGGITDRDRALAAEIEKLVASAAESGGS